MCTITTIGLLYKLCACTRNIMQPVAGSKMKPMGGFFPPTNSQTGSFKTNLRCFLTGNGGFIVLNHDLIYTLLPLVDCISRCENNVIPLTRYN